MSWHVKVIANRYADSVKLMGIARGLRGLGSVAQLVLDSVAQLGRLGGWGQGGCLWRAGQGRCAGERHADEQASKQAGRQAKEHTHTSTNHHRRAYLVLGALGRVLQRVRRRPLGQKQTSRLSVDRCQGRGGVGRGTHGRRCNTRKKTARRAIGPCRHRLHHAPPPRRRGPDVDPECCPVTRAGGGQGAGGVARACRDGRPACRCVCARGSIQVIRGQGGGKGG